MAQHMLDKNDEQIAAIEERIRAAHKALWGMNPAPAEQDTDRDD